MNTQKLLHSLIGLAGTISLTLSSCNNYDFGQEFYKNEVGLLSSGEMMIYDRQVLDLNAENQVINIVGNLSGSQRPGQDMSFTIVPDDSLFMRYNKTNFDLDESRFAHILPKDCYEMPSMTGTIKAGNGQGLIPIVIKNIERLSPDSTYLLDFKIDETVTPNVNVKKKHVLLKLSYKNEFASTKTSTDYTYRNTFVSVLTEGSNTSRKLSSSVRLFPLGKNTVRMLAGDETYKNYVEALPDINAKSIILEVGDINPKDESARFVTIKPYKTIEVVQMPAIANYSNTYRLTEDKLPGGRSDFYKEFQLHYKYRVRPDEPFKEVKASFRLKVEKYADKL